MLTDAFEDEVKNFRNEKVVIYLDKVTDLQVEIPIEFQNSLALILE